eukprot:CAMPEP_0177326092 /NCGR_PEP_ID=MMETSP0368-20130122/18159_1 /TAXON_ID=447022 ORGANISM="Scrippsiella hangoei-like, Strain SHHI-4" /NCGR_SAMPLE_ID=MMETSP0368 /ASSEMBLY_ACC=CAM_ASM_000363 /LENGTH=64 /DNA_ID=CAMNT_0018786037 /DNA_START=40 /DNA_END=234 /DNA_ORIENTATION=-
MAPAQTPRARAGSRSQLLPLDNAHLKKRPELQAHLALEQAQGHRPVMPGIVGGSSIVALKPAMA